MNAPLKSALVSLLAALPLAPSAVLAGIPTLAQAPIQPPLPATAQPQVQEQSENTVICKMTPSITGSRLGGGRECRTVLEWKLREQDAQRMVRQLQRTGRSGDQTSSMSGMGH